MSRICLCLTASGLDGIRRQLRQYEDVADMAELRVDLMDPSERTAAADLPGETSLPLILTARLPADGGRWGDRGETESQRQELLIRFLEMANWHWVDLEHDRPMAEVVSAAGAAGTRVIRSIHDFEGSLAHRPVTELKLQMKSMATGGALPKLAAHCDGSRSLLNLARLAIAVEDIGDKVILGMGEYGAPTRILADRMGSSWTYTSSFGGGDHPPAAPGQYDPSALVEFFRFRELGPDTPVYAVTGNPIAHSRSPDIHNRWLQDAGLPGTYIPIRSDDAAAMLETCDLWGIRGLSVTVPHKERALALCDYSGFLARRIGAANTLLRAGDGWRARNTDAGGFMAPLPDALGLANAEELNGMKALVIGAGGAARAAVHALARAGVELVILNRTATKAESLAGEVGARSGGLDPSSASLLADGIDFAVQTSAAGMHPLEGIDPLPWWDFAGCRLAYDMVYVPSETAFLAHAKAAGVPVLNGDGMLESQARLQFEMFTGVAPPS